MSSARNVLSSSLMSSRFIAFAIASIPIFLNRPAAWNARRRSSAADGRGAAESAGTAESAAESAAAAGGGVDAGVFTRSAGSGGDPRGALASPSPSPSPAAARVVARRS